MVQQTVSCTSRWAAENPRECWAGGGDFGPGFLYPGAEVARAAAATTTPSAAGGTTTGRAPGEHRAAGPRDGEREADQGEDGPDQGEALVAGQELHVASSGPARPASG